MFHCQVLHSSSLVYMSSIRLLRRNYLIPLLISSVILLLLSLLSLTLSVALGCMRSFARSRYLSLHLSPSPSLSLRLSHSLSLSLFLHLSVSSSLHFSYYLPPLSILFSTLYLSCYLVLFCVQCQMFSPCLHGILCTTFSLCYM